MFVFNDINAQWPFANVFLNPRYNGVDDNCYQIYVGEGKNISTLSCF